MNNQAVQNQTDELKEIINNASSTINNANSKILELEKQLKETKNKYWIPKDKEKYFYINDGCGDVCNSAWNNDTIDKYRLSIGSVYKTQKEAKKIGLGKVFEQQLYVKLQRFADENNDRKIDWNNKDQAKYYIEYNYDRKLICVDNYNYYREFQQDIYFTSREIAEKAIEKFKDDLIKYFEI